VAPLLELRKVTKRFGSTLAVDQLSLTLEPGEIHALLGENGAGKSTALGLVYGVVQPDEGDILIDGQKAAIASPAAAMALNISCVFQELSLAEGLSVAENIHAGHPPRRYGMIDQSEMRRAARQVLDEFGLAIDIDRPVGLLPTSTRQIVEIAKALSLRARIMLLDEPTSALTPDEVDTLFSILRKLAARGIGIIYVSHHLPEIFRIADRVSILRDGRLVGTHRTGETTQSRIVAEMVGRSLDADRKAARKSIGAEVLAIRNLSLRNAFSEVSFSVRAGEIVGLAGLVGSRKTEIAAAICGLLRPDGGDVAIDGKVVRPSDFRDAIRHGIVYVPEDRKTEGLFLDFSVGANLAAATLNSHSRFGFLRRRSIAAAAQAAIERFAIRAPGPEAPLGKLSGGNQQKVMLAKWLEAAPRILIVNEPTKGVDIGAKQQIHAELMKLAAEGMAILAVSSDFPELLALADRILVVKTGRIVGELAADAASETDLMMLASGASRRDRPEVAEALA
jgi:ABC-type sugar transport system ATPase subunit